MALSAHLQELTNKHENLDRTIQKEFKRPAPDTLKLSQLKKEKLRIKEQISHYRS